MAFDVAMLGLVVSKGVGFSTTSKFNLSTKDFVGRFCILHCCLLEHRFYMKIKCNKGCKLTLDINKKTFYHWSTTIFHFYTNKKDRNMNIFFQDHFPIDPFLLDSSSSSKENWKLNSTNHQNTKRNK